MAPLRQYFWSRLVRFRSHVGNNFTKLVPCLTQNTAFGHELYFTKVYFWWRYIDNTEVLVLYLVMFFKHNLFRLGCKHTTQLAKREVTTLLPKEKPKSSITNFLTKKGIKIFYNTSEMWQYYFELVVKRYNDFDQNRSDTRDGNDAVEKGDFPTLIIFKQKNCKWLLFLNTSKWKSFKRRKKLLPSLSHSLSCSVSHIVGHKHTHSGSLTLSLTYGLAWLNGKLESFRPKRVLRTFSI